MLRKVIGDKVYIQVVAKTIELQTRMFQEVFLLPEQAEELGLELIYLAHHIISGANDKDDTEGG